MINRPLLVSVLLAGSLPLFSQSTNGKHLGRPDRSEYGQVAGEEGRAHPAHRLTHRGTRQVKPGKRGLPSQLRLDESTLPGTLARLFSASGQEVATFPLTGTEQVILLPYLQPGEYTLRVEDESLITRSVMVL